MEGWGHIREVMRTKNLSYFKIEKNGWGRGGVSSRGDDVNQEF